MLLFRGLVYAERCIPIAAGLLCLYLLSNCDVGVTNNDGIDITTREVLDNVDEVKLKDAFVRVYNNLFVLTDSVTSVPSTLLLSLSHILVLFPMEPNLTQILSLPLGTALTIVFKSSQA